MTIRHLQIFTAVCRCRSISGAAAELGMTQPAVSIAVRELESYYRVRLFDRMNRRIYLTQAGETLLQYAGSILGACDEAAAVLRDSGGPARCLIGVNVTVSETVLPALLARLRADVPGLEPGVFVHNTQAIERRLRDNEIDFAIVDSPAGGAHQLTLPLYREEMAALCAPGFAGRAAAVRELAALPLLLREPGSGSRSCVEAVFEAHGCAPHPLVESISDLSLLRLAEQGYGCTVLPLSLAGESLRAGRLRVLPLADAVFSRRYFLVRDRRRYLSAAARRAVDSLRAWAEEEAARSE